MLKQISQTPGGVGCSRCRNNKGLPCFSNKGLPCFSNKGLPSPIPKLPRGFAGCVLCSGLVQSLLVAWQDGHTTSCPVTSSERTRHPRIHWPPQIRVARYQVGREAGFKNSEASVLQTDAMFERPPPVPVPPLPPPSPCSSPCCTHSSSHPPPSRPPPAQRGGRELREREQL